MICICQSISIHPTLWCSCSAKPTWSRYVFDTFAVLQFSQNSEDEIKQSRQVYLFLIVDAFSFDWSNNFLILKICHVYNLQYHLEVNDARRHGSASINHPPANNSRFDPGCKEKLFRFVHACLYNYIIAQHPNTTAVEEIPMIKLKIVGNFTDHKNGIVFENEGKFCRSCFLATKIRFP